MRAWIQSSLFGVPLPERILPSVSRTSSVLALARPGLRRVGMKKVSVPGMRALACPNALERPKRSTRSEEHTSELQSQSNLVCRLLLEKKKETPSTRSCRPLFVVRPLLAVQTQTSTHDKSLCVVTTTGATG